MSWYQPEASTSLALVDALPVGPDAAVVDVGAGASPFLPALAGRGFRDLTAVDLSAAALDALARAAGEPGAVRTEVADVRTWAPGRAYGLWHDRAVLHFVVAEEDRAAYLATLATAVPQGVAIVGTFAPDGPEECSGLPVHRYGPGDLTAALAAAGFVAVEERREVHTTPWGAEQPFTWVAARRG